MKSAKSLLNIVLAAVVLSCASAKVQIESNKEIDLNQYRTYDWLEQEEPYAYLTTRFDWKEI
ncbi:MAG: hypothetical protein ACE5I1_10525, partial [bacterium]